MGKKVAYIAPGYPSSTESDNYQRVGSFFEDNGFEIEYIDPDWSTYEGKPRTVSPTY